MQSKEGQTNHNSKNEQQSQRFIPFSMRFELQLNPQQKCSIIMKNFFFENINPCAENLKKRGKRKPEEKT